MKNWLYKLDVQQKGIMKHVIITGASKGFGRALALQLAEPNVELHLIARSSMDSLVEEIGSRSPVQTYEFDLSEVTHIPILSEQIFLNIDVKKSKSIVLINNAGLLKPIGPVGKYPVNDYLAALEVNFVAPLILTHQFVHKLQDRNTEKKIVMISSGAAVSAYHGWSHYCSTKAGLNHFVEVLALEQGNESYPIQVMAFNPGMMETDMQVELRKQSINNFPQVDKFIQAKESDRVGAPVKVAQKLKKVIWSDNFPNGKIVKVSDVP